MNRRDHCRNLPQRRDRRPQRPGSQGSSRVIRVSHGMVLAVVAIIAAAGPLYTALAGHGNFRGGAVGGVSIDAEGVLRSVTVDAKQSFRRIMLRDVKPAGTQLNAPVELRNVSLRGLEAAIAGAKPENFNQLPDEVKYLAGLQRIQYLVLSPEDNDILLVGPAEGWKVDDGGNVIGVTTGQPVLQLEDLAMAFRTVNAARQGGISCSIDPTPEGHQTCANSCPHSAKWGPTRSRACNKHSAPKPSLSPASQAIAISPAFSSPPTTT